MSGGFLQFVGGIYVLFNTIIGGIAIAAYFDGYQTIDGIFRFVSRVGPSIEPHHIYIAIVVFIWVVASIPGFMMVVTGEMNEMQDRSLKNNKKYAEANEEEIRALRNEIQATNRILTEILNKQR